jgi:hypothetical protein
VKRKAWKDSLSQLLKAKVFNSIIYVGRIKKKDEGV